MNITKHPKCENDHPMVVRKGKYGKFFGCVYYPNHKSTVNEPWCSNNHPMKKRKSKYGEFFSCINYQTCDSQAYDFELKNSRYIAILIKEFESKNPNLIPKKSDNSDYNFQRVSTYKKESNDNWYVEEVEKETKLLNKFKEELAKLPSNLLNEFYRLLDKGYTRDKLFKINDSIVLKEFLEFSFNNRTDTTINSMNTCASCGTVISFNGKCKCSG